MLYNNAKGGVAVEEKEFVWCGNDGCNGKMISHIEEWREKNETKTRKVWTCNKCGNVIRSAVVSK